MITIRYFASLREKLGDGESLSFDTLATPTVGGVRQALMARSEQHADALAVRAGIRVSCDHELCDEAHPVSEHAEVAFFPPVTGG